MSIQTASEAVDLACCAASCLVDLVFLWSNNFSLKHKVMNIWLWLEYLFPIQGIILFCVFGLCHKEHCSTGDIFTVSFLSCPLLQNEGTSQVTYTKTVLEWLWLQLVGSLKLYHLLVLIELFETYHNMWISIFEMVLPTNCSLNIGNFKIANHVWTAAKTNL